MRAVAPWLTRNLKRDNASVVSLLNKRPVVSVSGDPLCTFPSSLRMVRVLLGF